MWKRLVWIILAVSLLAAVPLLAQKDQPVDPASFVPADYAGFIQVHLGDNTSEALRRLNITAFTGSLFAPNRISLSNPLTYNDFVPVTALFDTERAAFSTTILPWLDGSFVLAYRKFDGAFQTDPNDVLLILPTSNFLLSTSLLSDIIKAQDLPSEETYRGVNIYIGDASAFAVTAEAVFVGTVEALKAALDIQAGVAARLTDSPAYTAVHQADPENPVVSAYVTADYLLPAVNGLLNGQTESQPMLSALGEALSQIRTDASFESRLLSGGFDGAEALVTIEGGGTGLTASVMFHGSDDALLASTEFDSSLYDVLPRNTMVAHSGSSISGLLYDVAAFLPLSNFAGQLYSGLPIDVQGTNNPLTPAPTSEQIQSAVSSFLTALGSSSGFDLQKDLLDHLSGDYVLAWIPRPNNPVPVVNTPFDTLIVANAEDAQAAQQGVSRLLQALFGLQEKALDPLDGWDFIGLGDENEVVFSIGAREGRLLIASGNAAQDALRALKGDNQLVTQDAWKTLTADGNLDWYVDILSFYNTFFPSAGGISANSDNRNYATLRLQGHPDGLFEVKLHVTLPFG